MILINKTVNGQIFKCDSCEAIHIEYKNLSFNFSIHQFDSFADFLSKLDGNKWEIKNKNSSFKRKIIIPTGNRSFNVLLNNEELQELNNLFNRIGNQPQPFKVEKRVVCSTQIVNMNFTQFLN